jgi:hypothetical protein
MTYYNLNYKGGSYVSFAMIGFWSCQVARSSWFSLVKILWLHSDFQVRARSTALLISRLIGNLLGRILGRDFLMITNRFILGKIRQSGLIFSFNSFNQRSVSAANNTYSGWVGTLRFWIRSSEQSSSVSLTGSPSRW